jgi:amidase
MSDIEHVLLNGSIAEIGALYRPRRTSVVDAVAWYLARIERFKDLNAVRDVSEHALDDAKHADHELAQGIDHGPLHGIPVLLKDNILARGLRASAGARALADSDPAAMPPWLPSCVPPAPSCWARPI